MFDIFPSNGLDRSILTPVFVGLGYLVAFSETLGWPFVGMVVPGYLASVCIAAPVTGATVLGESIVTFLVGRAIGEWIPRTGAWTVSFGRERFFLLIIVSVLVRLVSEGVVLPAIAEKTEFRHASELYSIGLVLVPLIANSYWNVGLKRGLFQSAVITGLTYATVQYALLPLTNLSLSRFELTYESVALSFLASSKAYLLLLTGTLIAARNNVAYGWDYNGILVPGLLTVAWYSPFKLVTTFGEAMIVAWAIRRLIQFPFFARVLIEGPRRALVVFFVGFLFKMVLGYGALWFFPGERVTDLYGFGYVLPTLLALKIGQKGSAGRVVMPTLQVSIAGFLGGNLLGFLLQTVWPIGLIAGHIPQGVLESQPSVVRELTLQTAWAPRGIHRMDSDIVNASGRFVRELRRDSPDRSIRQLGELGLRVVQTPRPNGGKWWIIRRHRDDADHYDQLPAITVSDSKRSSGIVVAFGNGAGPASALAVRAAHAMDA